MNYGEIKQNLISLGFAEESDYTEFEELGYTYDAINRSISQIGSQFPYIAKYEFSIDEEDTGTLYIDMTDRDGFLELAETPVLYERNDEEIFKKFGDYQVEMGHTLVIDADDLYGSFRVYYSRQCTQVTPETQNDFVPELPLKVHHLIPLLAAYYLWIDDDPTKAAQYYNLYETELGLILQKENMPRMRVVTEWSTLSKESRWYQEAARNEIARGGN